jgi:hypothetical protein
VQILNQEQSRPLGRRPLEEPARDTEKLALSRLGLHQRRRCSRIRDAEEVEENRKHIAEAFVKEQQAIGDLFARETGVVAIFDAEVAAEDLEDRDQRDALAGAAWATTPATAPWPARARRRRRSARRRASTRRRP